MTAISPTLRRRTIRSWWAAAGAAMIMGAMGAGAPAPLSTIGPTGALTDVTPGLPTGPATEAVVAARRVAAAQGARYAGTYWDATREVMVVTATGLGTATPGSAGSGILVETGVPRAETSGSAGHDVRLEPATYPLAELRDLAARAAAARNPDIAESYVDPSTNRVVLVARPGHRAALAAHTADPRITVRQAVAEPVRVAGGSPLVGGGAACTMGFTGTLRGVPVFLTAGHCGKQGTTFTSDGHSAGRVTDVVFPESDYAVGVFDGAGPRGVVATGPWGSVPVHGSLEAPSGARICAMGSASGWACGAIVATGVTVRYGEGATAQYVHNLTKVAVCRSGGDSGGPWLWGAQAQGLTSGGAGTHGPGCAGASGDQVAYLQPVNPVLEATGVVLDTASE